MNLFQTVNLPTYPPDYKESLSISDPPLLKAKNEYARRLKREVGPNMTVFSVDQKPPNMRFALCHIRDPRALSLLPLTISISTLILKGNYSKKTNVSLTVGELT